MPTPPGWLEPRSVARAISSGAAGMPTAAVTTVHTRAVAPSWPEVVRHAGVFNAQYGFSERRRARASSPSVWSTVAGKSFTLIKAPRVRAP